MSSENGMKGAAFCSRDVAAYKAGQAEELALRLLEAPAHQVDTETGELTDHPSRYFAALLVLEGAAENHVLATLRENDGAYEQGVPLLKPSLRISPAYSQALRRRAHGASTAAVERAVEQLPDSERYGYKKKFNWGYRWVHLTFTMTHADGSETFPEVKRFNKAWDKFRKRQVWTENVFAGVKGVEDRLTWRGSHVHGHVLALMRRVDLPSWVAAWRECLGGQADEPVGSIEMRTVRPKVSDPAAEETMAEALAEVTKYITKPGDLLDPDPETGRLVPAEVLVRLCQVPRWPRMFELLGAAREKAGPDAPSAAGLSLIRREYSTAGPEVVEPWDEEMDGPAPGRWVFFGKETQDSPPKGPTWRQLMGVMGLERWIDIVEARAARARAWRLRQLVARAVGPIVDLDGVQRGVGQSLSIPGPEREQVLREAYAL